MWGNAIIKLEDEVILECLPNIKKIVKEDGEKWLDIFS